MHTVDKSKDMFTRYNAGDFLKSPYSTESSYKDFIDKLGQVYITDIDVDKFAYDIDRGELKLNLKPLINMIDYQSLDTSDDKEKNILSLSANLMSISTYTIPIEADKAKWLYDVCEGSFSLFGTLKLRGAYLEIGRLFIYDPMNDRYMEICESGKDAERRLWQEQKREKELAKERRDKLIENGLFGLKWLFLIGAAVGVLVGLVLLIKLGIERIDFGGIITTSTRILQILGRVVGSFLVIIGLFEGAKKLDLTDQESPIMWIVSGIVSLRYLIPVFNRFEVMSLIEYVGESGLNILIVVIVSLPLTYLVYIVLAAFDLEVTGVVTAPIYILVLSIVRVVDERFGLPLKVNGFVDMVIYQARESLDLFGYILLVVSLIISVSLILFIIVKEYMSNKGKLERMAHELEILPGANAILFFFPTLVVCSYIAIYLQAFLLIWLMSLMR